MKGLLALTRRRAYCAVVLLVMGCSNGSTAPVNHQPELVTEYGGSFDTSELPDWFEGEVGRVSASYHEAGYRVSARGGGMAAPVPAPALVAPSRGHSVSAAVHPGFKPGLFGVACLLDHHEGEGYLGVVQQEGGDVLAGILRLDDHVFSAPRPLAVVPSLSPFQSATLSITCGVERDGEEGNIAFEIDGREVATLAIGSGVAEEYGSGAGVFVDGSPLRPSHVFRVTFSDFWFRAVGG